MTEAELLREHFQNDRRGHARGWSGRRSGGGKIDYFNQRWIDYTEVDLDEFAVAEAIGIVHADDIDETWKRWAEAIESGTPYRRRSFGFVEARTPVIAGFSAAPFRCSRRTARSHVGSAPRPTSTSRSGRGTA